MNREEKKLLEALCTEFIARSSALSSVAVAAVLPLAGDASTRQYFRVQLSGGKISSAILMKLAGAAGPFGGGPDRLTQDDTFVLLQAFLRENGIRVPELYFDGRAKSALLVEDIGDLFLWHIARNEKISLWERLPDQIDGDLVEHLFQKAVKLLFALQAIPPARGNIAFQRGAVFERYRREIAELKDYILEPRGARRSEFEPFDKAADAICETLCSHPEALSHIDFMAHNIAVAESLELILLDFQDMSLVSPVRDIVSLLNDRDMDMALGESRHARLLEQFLRGASEQQGYRISDLKEQYNQYLFHWDCRVGGRFALLSQKRPGSAYGEWLPGTLRRLGRTMLRIENDFPGIEDLLTILPRYIPEVAEGIQDPWDLPEIPV